LILDHAGAVYQHGLPEDEILWTLSTNKKAANPKHLARSALPSSRLCKCPKCDALRTAGDGCRVCGWEPKRRGEAVEFVDGDLARFSRSGMEPHTYSAADKQRWHAMLVYIARERGRKPGSAYYRYKEKFGHEPLTRYVVPMEPTAEVRSWSRSRDIAFAKSQSKKRGMA
jgi:hypothetical protein